LPDLTCCHAGERKSPSVTADEPDLGERSTSAAPETTSDKSSSSELSSANAQNLEPRTARLTGSGERGEVGAQVVAAAPNFVALSFALESLRESHIWAIPLQLLKKGTSQKGNEAPTTATKRCTQPYSPIVLIGKMK
jgi:hypothetical protein